MQTENKSIMLPGVNILPRSEYIRNMQPSPHLDSPQSMPGEGHQYIGNDCIAKTPSLKIESNYQLNLLLSQLNILLKDISLPSKILCFALDVFA